MRIPMVESNPPKAGSTNHDDPDETDIKYMRHEIDKDELEAAVNKLPPIQFAGRFGPALA